MLIGVTYAAAARLVEQGCQVVELALSSLIFSNEDVRSKLADMTDPNSDTCKGNREAGGGSTKADARNSHQAAQGQQAGAQAGVQA